MSSRRLPQAWESAFFHHVDTGHEAGLPGVEAGSVGARAEPLLQRFLTRGSMEDLYALAGLLAGPGRTATDAFEALTEFVDEVSNHKPHGHLIAPGELAYDLERSQLHPHAAPARTPGPQGGAPDLPDWVTVFVSTVGYSTFEQCLDCLRAQNCRFQLKVIENVAPMSAAFQRMLDECETPFYVQVDEDMLLYPEAVQTLFETIRGLDDGVAMYVACLFDEHMGRAIYGLKIFRADIVRRYPVRDVEGFEWDQVRRWRADGFRDVREPVEQADRSAPRTLGLHGTHWTPLMIYIRYFVLELTRRKGNKTHQWVAAESTKLLHRFLDTRSAIDLYALGGILAGRMQPELTTGRSKDFQQYRRTPGFDCFRRFVEALA